MTILFIGWAQSMVFAAPHKIVSKPAGEWNTLEANIIEQNYSVIINDQKITEFIGNRLLER
jgi:hypothetical protein